MEHTPTCFCGIDYGSKLAGTTRIAWLDAEHEKVRCIGSVKQQDADAFILDWMNRHKPDQVFLDAPLSLPKVYQFPEARGDYFYREADRALQAMSPMFLGGLTARAMRLRAVLLQDSVEVFEVYPAHLARIWEINQHGYKTKTHHPTACKSLIEAMTPISVAWEDITDWHAFDALLAFLIGWRYTNGDSQPYGCPEEGLIHV